MAVLAVVPNDREDVVDQLCLLQHHVSVGGGYVDPVGNSSLHLPRITKKAGPDDWSHGMFEVGEVPAVNSVHSNIVRHSVQPVGLRPMTLCKLGINLCCR